MTAKINIDKNMVEVLECCDHVFSHIIQVGPDSLDGFIDKYVTNFVHPEFKEKVIYNLSIGYLSKIFQSMQMTIKFDFAAENKYGENHWYSCSITPENDNSSNKFLLIAFKDISNKKEKELQILRRSERDSLTGLYNREIFKKQAEQYLLDMPNKLHALLLLDIDGFKQINDIFGHSTGDNTLLRISEILNKICTENALIGRLGGDEFQIFFSNSDSEQQVIDFAELVLNEIRNNLELDNVKNISCSAGIAFCPESGKSIDELYRLADMAMYHSKRCGKNRYSVYTDELKNIVYDNKLRNDEDETLFNKFLCSLYVNVDKSKQTEFVFKYFTDRYRSSSTKIMLVDNGIITEFYEYHSDGTKNVEHKKHNIPKNNIDKFLLVFFDSNIKYIKNCEQSENSDPFEIVSQSAKSSLLLKIPFRSGQSYAYVCLEDKNNVDFLNGANLEKIYAMAEIMISYLEPTLVSAILNSAVIDRPTPAALYVINRNNYKILYFNDPAKQIGNKVELGKYCYDVFMNRTSPCPDCPVCLIREGHTYQYQRYVGKKFTNMNVFATPVRWNGEIDACSIILSEIHNNKALKKDGILKKLIKKNIFTNRQYS